MPNQIVKVYQDDIQLVLRFATDNIPVMAYVNTQLRLRLHTEYDENLIEMIHDSYKGTIDVYFMPNDDGSVDTEMWDAFCEILDSYTYTLKDAKAMIDWMEECVKMDNQATVYSEILDGASC